MPKYLFLGFLVAVAAGLVALSMRHREETRAEPVISGAGSTFVYPLMAQWYSQYEKTDGGCRVGYRSIGSSAGIQSLIGRSVDFGCSESPMTDEQLDRARQAIGDVVHIPLVLGAVVPVYNLTDSGRPLNFDGSALADIFLGKIKKWNDPALTALNPDAKLPDREITVVHRSDGSGTTYIWSDFLAKVSPEWKKAVGAGAELRWPIGLAESGNDGVAERVKKTAGSIGYVELTYAYRLDLGIGQVKNRENEFVRASLSSIKTAAENMLGEIPDDLRFSLTNAAGKGVYPIVGTTWAIVPAGETGGKAAQVAHFLEWALGDGQGTIENLLYARLPDGLLEKARKKVNALSASR